MSASRMDQPLVREAVELHERKPLTQHDACPVCRAPLVLVINEVDVCEPMIDEHILPLWLGGSNDLSNRALYCIPCARAKTKREATERGKVLRLARDADPSTRRQPIRKLRGRGFPKDPLRP